MYYVYTLTDPMTAQIFYVGKGKHRRSKHHLQKSIWNNPKTSSNPYLYSHIKRLMENNNIPIIQHIFESEVENDALEYEEKLISRLGTFNTGGPLKNIFEGKGSRSYEWTTARKRSYKEKKRTLRKIDPSYEELYNLYVNENKKRSDLAEYYGISVSYLKKILNEHGIKKPKVLIDKNMIHRVIRCCVQCGSEFEIIPSKNNRFCSRKCADVGGRKKCAQIASRK